MKNRVVVLWIIVIQIAMVTSLSCSAGVIKEVPEDLLPAAEKILSERFSAYPQWYLDFQPYFHHGDSLMDFRLGEPYPCYQFKMKDIYYLKEKEDFKNIVKFRIWSIPIYLSNEEEPRTKFNVKKNSDGKWRWAGIGGNPKPILEARERWLHKKGYRCAPFYARRGPRKLIIIENADTLRFYIYSQNSKTAEILGISKNSEGYYPQLSLDSLIGYVKNNKKYSRDKVGLD